MGLLVPDYIFKNVAHITTEFLAERGIRALLLDVDNTLTSHGSQELSSEVAAWLQTMQKAGIRLAIVSNNTEKRVAPFAKKIGLNHKSFCCKPMPFGLAALRRSWGLPKRQVALVGDQIFTDALGASLYGVCMLLVQPLSEDTVATVRFKRKLEEPVLRRYYKKGGRLL